MRHNIDVDEFTLNAVKSSELRLNVEVMGYVNSILDIWDLT